MRCKERVAGWSGEDGPPRLKEQQVAGRVSELGSLQHEPAAIAVDQSMHVVRVNSIWLKVREEDVDVIESYEIKVGPVRHLS